MKRKRLQLLLALLMTAAATGAWAESGKCGPNVHWTLEGGKMTISGTGEMTSWQNANKVPWNNYKSQIRSVVIGDGVTSIGEYAFEECMNIASVSFGKDVKTIGMNAFYNCPSLSEVTIPANVETIKRDAFVNCKSLSKVTVLRPAKDGVTKLSGLYIVNAAGVYSGLIYVPAGSGETYKAKWPVIYKDNILELIPTYSVKMADGTKDAANWTISDGTTTKTGDEGLDAVAEGQSVTLKYNGRLKVKSVTATTDYDPLATPLTVEALTAGTIVVNIADVHGVPTTLSTGMKYSVNGGTKTTITETTSIEGLKAGDKVQFYGNGTQTQAYGNDQVVSIQGSSDGFQTKVYGNIMSLLDEEGFATKTDLPNAYYVFYELFWYNKTLIDASELLLPAATLAYGCYQQMFQGCTSLIKAPKLPATTLAEQCYLGMFSACASLTSAYVKAAYPGENNMCRDMFNGCTATDAVLHTTSGNKASWETKMGEGKTWPTWSVADDWQD